MSILEATATCMGGALLLLAGKRFRNKREHAPAPKHVSYVRIRVTDMKASEAFYDRLGLARVRDGSLHPQNQKHSLLKSPSAGVIRQPYILLELRDEIDSVGKHDNQAPNQNSHAADHVGIARMCLIVEDVREVVTRMKEKVGMHPMAPPIEGMLPKTEDEIDVAAYRDPSGNIVELLSFKKQNPLLSVLSSICRVRLFPLFLHVNVNVSCYATSLKAYKKIGYAVSQDFGRFGNSTLHKALAVPDPGIAAHVSLIKLYGDRLFVLELMEWEDPKTTVTQVAGTPSVSIALAVRDVASTIDQLVSNGGDSGLSSWRLHHGPRRVSLPPPLGKATTATILDPNGMPMELVSYS